MPDADDLWGELGASKPEPTPTAAEPAPQPQEDPDALARAVEEANKLVAKMKDAGRSDAVSHEEIRNALAAIRSARTTATKARGKAKSAPADLDAIFGTA